jgi:hypothetical protein
VPPDGRRVRQLTRPPCALALYGDPAAVIVNKGGEVRLNLHSLSYLEMSKLLISAAMILTRSGSMICGI